jgi:hypothetical protein
VFWEGGTGQDEKNLQLQNERSNSAGLPIPGSAEAIPAATLAELIWSILRILLSGTTIMHASFLKIH